MRGSNNYGPRQYPEKLIPLMVLNALHGDPPILLLDDVSSELDAKRNAFLFDFLARIECQCSPDYQHTAFSPVVTYLQRFLRFTREEPVAERLRKLNQAT